MIGTEQHRAEQNRTGLFQLEGIYNNHVAQLSEKLRAYQVKHVINGIVQMPLKH